MRDRVVNSLRIDDPTPNGGTYSIAYWQGADGQPTEREQAVSAEIVEYDGNDNAIFRTYLTVAA